MCLFAPACHGNQPVEGNDAGVLKCTRDLRVYVRYAPAPEHVTVRPLA